MPDQRIKGQEVSVLLTRDGTLEASFDAVQNMNVEFEFETKTQGYLGEKGNRVDYILNQVKFDLELNLHNQEWVPFLVAMIDKAKRNTPDTVFNITGVFSFPNGQTPTLTLGNVAWGAVPLTISSRGDYVKKKLQGVCSPADVDLETS